MRDLILIAFLAAAMLTTIRYPFAGLLLWAWFVLATPQAATYWAASLSLNMIIAAVTFVVFFFHGEFTRLKMSALSWLMVLFTFWLWIAQINSLMPEYSAEFFDRFFKVMIFVFLCATVVTSRLRFHALLWLLVMVMGFYGAMGGAYTIITLGQGRFIGLVGTMLEDNNHIGIAMASCLPIYLYFARQASHKIVRLGTIAIFVMTIIAIIGTQSRGAFVALVVFSGMMWLRSNNKAITAILVVISGIITLQVVPDDWTNRMETISEAGSDQSFRGRLDAWEINWLLAKENPVTGAGQRVPYLPDVSRTVSDLTPRAAHSIYFEVLGGTGFVGLAIFLSIFATAFFKARQAERAFSKEVEDSWRSVYARYAQMSLVTFGVGAASVSMEMWEGYWIVIALISALPNIQTKAQTIKQDYRLRRIRGEEIANAREQIKSKLPPQDLSS